LTAGFGPAALLSVLSFLLKGSYQKSVRAFFYAGRAIQIPLEAKIEAILKTDFEEFLSTELD